MVRLGRALTDPDLRPPVMALYVYNSNPAAVCPNSSLVLEGLAREDLFTVVHEQVQTDTADYADLLLPATTSMEHEDLYRSFGHLYLQLAEPVIPPVGEARSNWEVFGQLARAMGIRDSHYETPLPSADRRASPRRGPVTDGVTHAAPRAERSVRIAVPRPFLPFADGAPTPSGRVEFYSETLLRAGAASAAHVRPAPGEPDDPAIGSRLPAPLPRPAEPVLPELVLQPVERSSGRGREARPSSSTRRMRPSGRSTRGTWSRSPTTGVGPASRRSCRTTRRRARWSSRGSGGTSTCRAAGGSTSLTSDGLADMGGGPAFHSTMVEVSRADPSEATFSGHAQRDAARPTGEARPRR